MKFLRLKIFLCVWALALLAEGVRATSDQVSIQNPDEEPLKIPEKPSEDQEEEKKMFNEIVKTAADKQEAESVQKQEGGEAGSDTTSGTPKTDQTQETVKPVDTPTGDSGEKDLDLLKKDLASDSLQITDSQENSGKSVLEDPKAKEETGSIEKPVGGSQDPQDDLAKNKIAPGESAEEAKEKSGNPSAELFKLPEVNDAEEPEKPAEPLLAVLPIQNNEPATKSTELTSPQSTNDQTEKSIGSEVAVGEVTQSGEVKLEPIIPVAKEEEKKGEEEVSTKAQEIAKAIEEDEGHVPPLDTQVAALNDSPTSLAALGIEEEKKDSPTENEPIKVDSIISVAPGSVSKSTKTHATMSKIQDSTPSLSESSAKESEVPDFKEAYQSVGTIEKTEAAQNPHATDAADVSGVDSSFLKSTKTEHPHVVHKVSAVHSHLPKKIAFKSGKDESETKLTPEAIDSAIQSLSVTKVPTAHLSIRKRTPLQSIPGKVMAKHTQRTPAAQPGIAPTPVIQQAALDTPATPAQSSFIEDQCSTLSQQIVVLGRSSIPVNGKLLSQVITKFRKLLAVAGATHVALSPCCRKAFEHLVNVVYCKVTGSVVFLKDLLIDDFIENQDLLKQARYNLHYPDVAPELQWADKRLNLARNEMARNYQFYVTNEFLSGPTPDLRRELLGALVSMHRIDSLHKQAYLQLVESMKAPNRHQFVSGEVIQMLKKTYFNMDDLSVNSKILVAYYPALVKVEKLVKAMEAPCKESAIIYRNLALEGIAEAQRRLVQIPSPTPAQRMLSGISRLNVGSTPPPRSLQNELQKEFTETTNEMKQAAKQAFAVVQKATAPVVNVLNKIPKKAGVKMHNKRDEFISAVGQGAMGYAVVGNARDDANTKVKMRNLSRQNTIRELVLNGMSRMNSRLNQVHQQLKLLDARTASLTESMARNIASKSSYDEQDASSKMTLI